MESYSGKVVIQQRVLPSYRASLFEEIADRCPNGFSLFVGEPREEEAIKTATSLTSGRLVKADNQHFFRGKYYFCKQKGFVEMLEDFQPDALIIEANPRNISTPSAINWMHAHGKKVSGWGLGAPPINGLFTNFRKNRRQKLYASLDSIVSYSQRGADEYRSMGFPKNKIFVAYNAAAPAPKGSLPKKPIQFNGPPAISPTVMALVFLSICPMKFGAALKVLLPVIINSLPLCNEFVLNTNSRTSGGRSEPSPPSLNLKSIMNLSI